MSTQKQPSHEEISETKTTPLTLETLQARRDEIIALAERYGAYNVRVFGSVARRDATPASDVDLLVSFKPGTSLFEFSALWQALQELLACEVNIVSEGGLKERFRQRIEKDLIAL